MAVTCSTLVDPGVPKGTPASTTILLPFCVILCRSAIRRALPTISSNVSISLVRTAWTPHVKPSFRAVSSRGVKARIGVSGRSRATRRTVLPDEVKQVIALAPTTETMPAAPSASASAVVASGLVSVKCSRAK